MRKLLDGLRGVTGWARATDPATSQQAACAATPAGESRTAAGRQNMRRRIAREYLAHPEGLTDEEATHRAGLPTGWRRCSELRQAGVLEPTGVTRITSYGRQARVCRLTEPARAELQGEGA
jgi:hypothetical protein